MKRIEIFCCFLFWFSQSFIPFLPGKIRKLNFVFNPKDPNEQMDFMIYLYYVPDATQSVVTLPYLPHAADADKPCECDRYALSLKQKYFTPQPFLFLSCKLKGVRA